MPKIYVYDTTLRDGAQGEGISFSVDDKIRIARRLDAFGMDYIEGGWPGALPKDTEFFARMRSIPLRHAKLAAFGMTRRAKTAEEDEGLRQLLDARTPVITLVGKSHDYHVTDALRIPLEENLAMITDSVRYLKEQGREVIFDAEHFFDGYKDNPEYALAALQAAVDGGVDVLVPCDTNGGTLPHEVAEIVAAVVARFPDVAVGMHPHDDTDCGTANALAAVRSGAVHVQGTTNGYGERTGNANILPIAAGLRLKMGLDCLTEAAMADLTDLSAFVDEVANMTPNPRAPYVGRNAFTHKAGLHVDAIMKASARAYEHLDPALVGNVRRLPVSEMSGGATIAHKASEMGYDLSKRSPETKAVLSEVESREREGYSFEGAEASFELLLKKATGRYRKLFELVGFRVLVEKRAGDVYPITEATLRLRVGDEEYLTVAEGDGPVHALDGALRSALSRFYPEVNAIRLTDFKVRVVTSGEGTAAKVRTIVESTADHGESWSTVGVSTNIIEASWQALVDAVEYGLLKERGK